VAVDIEPATRHFRRCGRWEVVRCWPISPQIIIPPLAAGRRYDIAADIDPAARHSRHSRRCGRSPLAADGELPHGMMLPHYIAAAPSCSVHMPDVLLADYMVVSHQMGLSDDPLMLPRRKACRMIHLRLYTDCKDCFSPHSELNEMQNWAWESSGRRNALSLSYCFGGRVGGITSRRLPEFHNFQLPSHMPRLTAALHLFWIIGSSRYESQLRR